MKTCQLVGIDVSAAELVVAIDREGEILITHFSNTAAGHKKLVGYITKRGRYARVCLEATGVYHTSLSLCLSRSLRTEVMVVNPRAIKHFAQALMRRSKTDATDAQVLLTYAQRMTFQAWQPPSETVLELQAISRRIRQLKEERIREKNRAHSDECSGGSGKVIAQDIRVNLRHLEKRMLLLESKAVELVKSEERLQEAFELLLSIKGVATRSAVQLLSELMSLPEEMKGSQWVAHAGLDPRAIESGSSLNKPRHISKAGNKYLRTALFMPAWVAVQRDPHVGAFYKKLIRAGKKPMQAIVAVMRKLLLSIWGILHSGSPWCGEKFYPGKIAGNQA